MDSAQESKEMFEIAYLGLFGEIKRKFDSMERAEQWLRQVGKYRSRWKVSWIIN